MTGEVQFIKKQMFGGFNREDVVEYVAKIAKERNEAREANAEAQEKIEVLVSEISDLLVELELCKSIIGEMEKQNKPSLISDEPLRKENIVNDASALKPEILLEKLSKNENENKEVIASSWAVEETATQESELSAEIERYNSLRKNTAAEEPIVVEVDDEEETIGDEIPEFHFNPDW